MVNKKAESLLFLLLHLLPFSLQTHTTFFWMKQSDNTGFSNHLETLWMEILEQQNEIGDTVVISNLMFKDPEHTNGYILARASEFNDEFMVILHGNMLQTNRNPIYMITDMHIDDVSRKDIIEIIRKHDKLRPIFTYWSGVPIYISLNMFFISSNLQDQHMYYIYETCAYCSSGNHTIMLNNMWSPSMGFKKSLSLQPSFKGLLYNATLIAGCRNHNGVFARIGTDKSGKAIWSGYIYEMLVLLGKHMQFNLDVILSDGLAGEVIDGNPTGILKLVSIGKVDIGAGYLYPTWERYQFVDFSASYDSVSEVIVTDEPPRSLRFFAFLQPFPPLMWFIISFSVPAVAGTLYIVNRFSPGQHHNIAFSECLWHVASIIFWDTTKLKSPSPGTIVLLSSYLLSCYLIITFFISECTSLMTKEPYKYPPINSMEDFLQHDLKWIGYNGFPITNWLKNSSELMRSRHIHQGGNSYFVNPQIKALQMMLDEPRTYILPTDRYGAAATIDLYFTDLNREHKFHISNKILSSSALIIFLQKHTAYQEAFNIHLLQLQQYGIASKLIGDTVDSYKKLGRKLAKHENRLPDPKSPETIQIQHMLGVFVFYVIGLALAFLAFLGEHLYFLYIYYKFMLTLPQLGFS